MTNEIIAFGLGSAVLIWFSRKPLCNPGQHGFYRFFSWEAILGLVILNHKPWGESPFSPHQMASWLLMILSIIIVILAVRELRMHGDAGQHREDGSLYAFEKTTQLVSSGIFGIIRHPMYTSLLALAWGAYFQDPNFAGTGIVGIATLSLWLTARADEKECLAYFGADYAAYMQRTRRFIPYIL